MALIIIRRCWLNFPILVCACLGHLSRLRIEAGMILDFQTVVQCMCFLILYSNGCHGMMRYLHVSPSETRTLSSSLSNARHIALRLHIFSRQELRKYLNAMI